MEYVAGTRANKGQTSYTRAEALDLFAPPPPKRRCPSSISRRSLQPVFIETLELAGESGVAFNGVLCGRATWKDGIAIYAKQGADASASARDHRCRKHPERQQGLEAASPWTLKVNP